jgi:hypothetical protein
MVGWKAACFLVQKNGQKKGGLNEDIVSVNAYVCMITNLRLQQKPGRYFFILYILIFVDSYLPPFPRFKDY